jgi:SAM-dependent methyltransferase
MIDIDTPTDIIRAKPALKYVFKYMNFDTVLDVGCGHGVHSTIFKEAGKKVTSTDYSTLYPGTIIGLYNNLEFQTHDLTWASHVLEHQPDPHQFLKKMRNETKEGGWTCITVPPLKHSIVGGHVSLWNAGLLMYHLVLAGFNCKDAKIHQQDYNISIIARAESFLLPELNYDSGDVDTLAPWLPAFCKEGFNGDIKEWNWTQ